MNAGVQMQAPPAVRARSLAYYLTFAVAGQAGGSFLGGWLAEHAGLADAFRICGAALLLLSLVVAVAYRPRSPS